MKSSSSSYSKPTQSYVMIIATAILESSDQRMSLGAIYNWIEKHYPYFTNNDATQGYVRESHQRVHNFSLSLESASTESAVEIVLLLGFQTIIK